MIKIDFHKESFFKSFLLFFIVIEMFLSLIFYNYLKIEKEHLEENLFLQMKNYSFNFDGNKFDIDIIPNHNQALYEMHQDSDYLFILVDIKQSKDELLKIYYPKQKFTKEYNSIKKKLIKKFVFFSILAIIISVLFSIYSLYPLWQSFVILKEFIKDIIHDINTPISSIKLNLSLLEKNDETLLIHQSLSTLSMLHKNLDNYLNDTKANLADYSIKEILEEQINFFRSLYDYIHWQVDIEDDTISTDKYILSRVIYNLLNNACKYNIKNGFVKISYHNKTITISNSSYGIKNIKKVFDRFYKESDRGLGIGLHIVAKLLKELGYKYSLELDKDNIVKIIIRLK